MRGRIAGGVILLALLLCPVAGASTPTAPWNQSGYNAIVQTVQAHQPTFPARECSVLAPQYAGLVRQVTDGEGSSVQETVWYYGDAINAAITDCHNAGGGTVVVPADGSLNGNGVYYSGAITLLSNVNLQIASGATVKFVRNPSNAYYPLVLTSHSDMDFYSYSPLVYALNQKNIGLTGGGTLDAQYNVSPWQFPSGGSAPAGTDTALAEMNNAGVPVDQRIFTGDGSLPSQIAVPQRCPAQAQDWGPCPSVQSTPPPAGTTAYQSTLAPQFVEFNHSSNILVQGITMVNTQFVNIHPLNSEYITINGVTIDDAAHLTDDGIDVDSCRYVVISQNSITTEDDGVAVKSGRDLDGRELRAPSENIIIQNNTFTKPVKFARGTSAIAFGSEMSGGIQNVFKQNDVAGGPGLGELFYLKTNSYRGGAIANIYARNSTAGQVTWGLVRIASSYGETNPQPNGDVFDPTIQGVYLNNVNSTASNTVSPFSSVTVSRSPIANVSWMNSAFDTASAFASSFTAAGSEFFAGLQIRNVTLTNPSTQASVIYNSKVLGLANQTTAVTSSGPVHLTAETPGCQVCTVNHLGTETFTLSGKVNGYPTLKPTVQVFLDRGASPIPVTVNPDGTFTTGQITLNDDQYWYEGHHYLSINLLNGINVNTLVYQVAA